MLRNRHPVSRRYPILIPIAEQYNQRESLWRVLADIAALVILLIATLIAHFVAKPFTRGFFCSDETIRYPHKDNTVPTFVAVLLSVAIPLGWMWFTEFIKQVYFALYPKEKFITRFELYGAHVMYVSAFVRNLYILTVVFLFGYLATWLLTEVAKNLVGELRPHFLAVCKPTYNCTSITSLYQYDAYLQEGLDYKCQNSDDSAVREARRSFFSGHASSVFYGFGWLIMYIHMAWAWRHLGIVGHVFQVGFAVFASYIAYSRISDFQHHWHDVLVGAIVGALIAFFTFKFILNWRHDSARFLPYITKTQQQGPASVFRPSMSNNRHISTFSDYAQIRRY